MDIYHEGLLKHAHMDQPQFNESYKAKHILTIFHPATPVVSIFFQAARLAAQRQSKKYQLDANDGHPVG